MLLVFRPFEEHQQHDPGREVCQGPLESETDRQGSRTEYRDDRCRRNAKQSEHREQHERHDEEVDEPGDERDYGLVDSGAFEASARDPASPAGDHATEDENGDCAQYLKAPGRQHVYGLTDHGSDVELLHFRSAPSAAPLTVPGWVRRSPPGRRFQPIPYRCGTLVSSR